MLEKELQKCAKESSKDTLLKKLDSQITSMRDLVKRAKIWTVRKMKRHIENLAKKGTKKPGWNEKAERKCKNLEKEITHIMELDVHDIILTALYLSDKCIKLFNAGKLTLGQDRARVRVASQSAIQKSVQEFYSELKTDQLSEIVVQLENRLKKRKVDCEFKKVKPEDVQNEAASEEDEEKEEEESTSLRSSKSPELAELSKESKKVTKSQKDSSNKKPKSDKSKVQPKIAKQEDSTDSEEEEKEHIQMNSSFWENMQEDSEEDQSEGEESEEDNSPSAPKVVKSQPAPAKGLATMINEVLADGELALEPLEDEDESTLHANIDSNYLADQDAPEVHNALEGITNKLPKVVKGHKPQGQHHAERSQGKESGQTKGFYKKGKFISFETFKGKSGGTPNQKGTKRAFQGRPQRDNGKRQKKF